MNKTELTPEKLEHLNQLVSKGREFGLIYKFDAIGILMSRIKGLKLEGSNGKAKGVKLAAELLSGLKPVQDVAPVTRCKDCLLYNKQTAFCGRYHTAFPEDGFCSQPEPIPKQK